MKTMILALACLSLLATSAPAQTTGNVTQEPVNTKVDLDWHRDRHPVQPVPEPGTMALASMGLIALGAAARKRRK